MFIYAKHNLLSIVLRTIGASRSLKCYYEQILDIRFFTFRTQ